LEGETILAFSFEIVDPTGNTSTTADVSLTVSPTSAIITSANMTPGSSTTGVVNVSNTGTVDEFYQITINWSPTGTTTQSAATRLVSELVVSVSAGSPSATATPLFAGSMIDVVDTPASPGQSLPLSVGNENVQFEVVLPSTATSVYQNIDIGFDIQFVALS
jgi:hypothetical protein